MKKKKKDRVSLLCKMNLISQSLFWISQIKAELQIAKEYEVMNLII